MESSLEGRSILLNILYDLQNDYLPQNLKNDFFSELEQLWIDSNDQDSVRIFNQAKKRDDKYLCQGQDIPLDSRQCSRVIGAKTFYKEHVKSDYKFDISVVSPHIETWRQLENYDCADFGTGQMPPSSRRPCAWVTQTKVIEEMNSTTDVRDSLGLFKTQRVSQASDHFTVSSRVDLNDYLIVDYPEELMKKTSVKAPTFLDNGTVLIYRSNRSNDGWGIAFNLRNYENGFPEAVYPRVSFGSGFRIKYFKKNQDFENSYDEKIAVQSYPLQWSENSKNNLINLIEI